jgi:tetratricopeptide (TPR) repeat protein
LNYRIANDAEVNELYPVFAQRESEWKYKKDAIYFAKGITEFQRNQFALAKDLFGKIEKSSAYYLKAQYLIGHCWCKENQYQKAVDIFNEILITNKQDDIWEESAIVAGDIKVTLADYNNAWGYYRLIKETSALFPRGLVGQAICHYMREEYAIADSLVDIVLTKFEGSQYSLMARCLKANILKKSGHIEPGSGQYDLVLHESGTKISLSESYIERLKTIYLLNELRVSEEEILDTGDENLFNRYWLLRLNLEKLLKRALYSEVLEVKPGFQEYIDEKLNVMKVVEEFIDLADSVANINNLDLTEYYAKVQDRMSELSKMIQGAGIGQLKKLPNYYTITDADFTKEALDSLYFATSGELDKLTQELNSTTFALETAEGSVGYEERAKMLETVDDIIQWRQMLDIRLSRDFTKMGRNDKLDFTRWSHIAFHKSMVPGSDFDDLKSNQKRIKAIDEYIQALGSIAYQFGVNVKEK